MKKRWLAGVAAAAMALSMTTCGRGTSNTTAATAADTTTAQIDAPAATVDTEAQASNWIPSTTASIVVPAGAGGNTDLSARASAELTRKMAGADFIVVNANDAVSSVAADQMPPAAPDGRIFLYDHNLVNVTNISNVTDYNHIAFRSGPTFALDPAQQVYANPDKYRVLDGFIKAVKAAPGQLKACIEVGTYTYYGPLAFKKVAGIDLDLVDVGPGSDKVAAMLFGQADLMPGAYVNCKDYLGAGQFVCLDTPTEERYNLAKDISTLKEQGMNLVYSNREFPLYFPKKTPDSVIAWYDNLVKEMTSDPEAQEAIKKAEAEPYCLSTADSGKNDERIYTEIKKTAGDLAK